MPAISNKVESATILTETLRVARACSKLNYFIDKTVELEIYFDEWVWRAVSHKIYYKIGINDCRDNLIKFLKTYIKNKIFSLFRKL